MLSLILSVLGASQAASYPSTTVEVLEDESRFHAEWAEGVALAEGLADAAPYYRPRKPSPVTVPLHGMVAIGDVLMAPKMVEIGAPEAEGISLTDNTTMRGYSATLDGGRPVHLWLQAVEREVAPTNAFITDAWTVVAYEDGRARRIWQHQDVTVTLHGDTSEGTQLAIIDLEWSGKTVERYTIRLHAADQLQQTVYTRQP